MNNNEIRLSILFQYYRAMFSEQYYGNREENNELKDISFEIINANKIYLMDKDLINGSKSYTGRNCHALTSDLTAWGMDVVEDIMHQSLDQMDNEISSAINKEDTDNKKAIKLYEKCLKLAPTCEIVVRIAGEIFSKL